jgi:hypothetical protein
MMKNAPNKGKAKITCKLTNTGKKGGSEVVQLYIVSERREDNTMAVIKNTRVTTECNTGVLIYYIMFLTSRIQAEYRQQQLNRSLRQRSDP